MKHRRVLVTGADGFVGRALASGFADLGAEVIGVDRAFGVGAETDRIHRVTAELDQGMPMEVPRVDLVVHSAWVTTDPATLGSTRAEYTALNLRPLLAVLAYASRNDGVAFVFLSSSGVFGPNDAAEGLSDTVDPTGTSPYAAAKRAGELLVQTALASGASDPDTAVHVVRLGHLFGPDEAARPSRVRVSPVARWLAAAREGRPLEVRSDDPARDWTFTSDLPPALAKLADGPAAGRPVHLGSPHVWRDSALAALITSEVPGSDRVNVPAAERLKPPMVPSDLPALRDFAWTDPPAGLQAILAREVVA